MNGLEQESAGHASGGLPLRVVDSVLTSPPLGIGEEDSVPGLHVCVSFGLRLSAGRYTNARHLRWVSCDPVHPCVFSGYAL